MLAILKTVNGFTEKIEYGILVTLMALASLFTILQVVARYVFNYPFTWPEEVLPLILVWMTFAGASGLLKQRKHIEIDFFVLLLPKKWQRAVDLLNASLIFCFCGVLAYGAYKLQSLQSHHYTVVLRIPKNFFTLPVLIAGVSMCLYLFLAVLSFWGSSPPLKQKRKGRNDGSHGSLGFFSPMLMFLRCPIGFSMGISSLFYFLISHRPLQVIALQMSAGITSYTFLAVPSLSWRVN